MCKPPTPDRFSIRHFLTTVSPAEPHFFSLSLISLPCLLWLSPTTPLPRWYLLLSLTAVFSSDLKHTWEQSWRCSGRILLRIYSLTIFPLFPRGAGTDPPHQGTSTSGDPCNWEQYQNPIHFWSLNIFEKAAHLSLSTSSMVWAWIKILWY